MKKTIECTPIFEGNLVDSEIFQDCIGYAIWSPVPLRIGDNVFHGIAQHGDNTIYAVQRGEGEIYKTDGFDIGQYDVWYWPDV